MIKKINQTLILLYKRKHLRQNAQGLIEYGLIVLLIALVVLAILGLLGGQLDDFFQSIVEAFSN